MFTMKEFLTVGKDQQAVPDINLSTESTVNQVEADDSIDIPTPDRTVLYGGLTAFDGQTANGERGEHHHLHRVDSPNGIMGADESCLSTTVDRCIGIDHGLCSPRIKEETIVLSVDLYWQNHLVSLPFNSDGIDEIRTVELEIMAIASQLRISFDAQQTQ